MQMKGAVFLLDRPHLSLTKARLSTHTIVGLLSLSG